MKKKILISTGGSGGHVIPAITFYDHLKENFEIFLTTDKRGVRFINQNKYIFNIINVPQLTKNFFKIPFNLIFFLLSILKSIFFIKKNEIRIVISTGGYMSLPICIAAKILNCKVFLFEPNMTIGRSNLFFLKQCSKIFCYANKINNFPEKYNEKLELIYPLLRKEVYNEKKNLNSQFEKKITILIFGGSQGADFLQNNLKKCMVELSKNFEIFVNHQTNEQNYKDLEIFYKKNDIKFNLFDFDESLTKLITKSDLCITRSGASSLAELVHLNIPFITIPFPYAKDNHQFHNGIFYKNKNCCWLLEQKNIKNNELFDLIMRIITDHKDVESKIIEMQKISYQNTWNNINQKILSTINEN